MRVTGVEEIFLSASIPEPIRMSFDQLETRTALLVRIETDAGLIGLGEIWTNFPHWLPWDKIQWLRRMTPVLLECDIGEPRQVWRQLQQQFYVPALQAGTLGLVYQVMSGIDVALWDIAAQAAEVPLYRFLRRDSAAPHRVTVYASGLGPRIVPDQIERWMRAGIKAFKLKVGFDEHQDRENIRRLRDLIGSDGRLMLDANQAWTLPEAVRIARSISRFDPLWVEEPVRGGDLDELAAFRQQTGLRTAAGENLYGISSLVRALDAGALDVVQPDVTKTSGLTDTVTVAQMASIRRKTFAPHCFGSAVGLMASAHLVGASDGETLLEFDINANPLREDLLTDHPRIHDGYLPLPESPGLGIELRTEALTSMRVERGG